MSNKLQPLVSVIVPCYNQAHYLSDALGSVLGQTYSHWECIIVNDGSPDNTESVASEWVAKDAKFKYVSKPNGGLSSARNAGIQQAQGEYILPLDADDYLSENYIKVCLQSLLTDSNCKISYGQAKFFGILDAKWELPEYDFKHLLIENMIFCTALFRKRDWEMNHGYDENLVYGHEDWEFWINLLKRGGRAVQNQGCIFYYRLKEKSMLKSMTVDTQKLLFSYEYIWSKHKDLYASSELSFDLLKIINAQKAELKVLLNQKLDAHDSQVATINAQLAERDAQLAECDAQLAECDAQLAEIYNSKAWRMVTFIRMLKGLPRRTYSKFKSLRQNAEYPDGFLALWKKTVFIWKLGGWQSLWRRAVAYIQRQAGQSGENSKSFFDLYFASVLSSVIPAQKGVIFVSHNASPTGAPINLLNQCRAYRDLYGNNIVIVVISGGALLSEFQNVGVTIDLHRIATNITVDEHVDFVFSKLRQLGYSRCIANTVVSGALSDVFKKNHLEVIYQIHELPQTIEIGGWTNYAKNIASSGSIVIFATNFVAERFISSFGLPTDLVKIIPQGVRSEMIYQGTRQSARTRLLNRLRIPDAQAIKIVLGAGPATYMPKGTDLFFDVAGSLHSKGQLGAIHFVWLGSRDDYFENWKKYIAPKLPYRAQVHFLDFEPNPAYIFAGADLFLLTSREDAFPSVALEALANDVPVIAFAETSGIQEILNDTNGAVVAHLDVHEMADAALRILANVENMHPATIKLNSFPDFVKAAISLLQKTDDGFQQRHQVTVVVPNYNYEKYLPQRLESIINQTYPPSEILFLDDVSSDCSVDVATKILQTCGIPYKIIVNEQNQGVFRQWLKGIREASHEYLWIAEADDFADVDFLARLMPAFVDDDVNLACCQLAWVDENSQPYPDYTYQDYVCDLSPTRWLSDYLENGQYEVSNYLGVRNTIPNVSGVVFRKQALQRLDEKLLDFHYAGDWFAYLQTLRQGKIFYSATVMNFHRRHRRSTIADANGNAPFFEEVRKIYQCIADNFLVNINTIDKMERNLASEKNADRVSELNRRFFETLRKKTVASIQSRRRLKILVVLSEFKVGGGEITGLRLANYLAKTHEVYLYAAKKESSPSFLAMISPDVQVIDDEPALSRLIHSGNLDFVNSHVWWGDKLTYSLLKDNSVYWILSMHGCYEMLVENPQVDPDFQHLYKPIIERASNITYDTKRNLRILDYLHNQTFLSKTRQIYHGYERKSPEQVITREMLSLDPETFIFVFAGRGIREKGWEEVIQAAINLHEKGFNLALLMFGDSDYVQSLKKRYEQTNIIMFMGETSNLAGYLAIADCGILPTYFFSESQPLTVIEFLAAGLPVISTDIGEIKAMLEMDRTSAGIALPLKNGKLSEALLRDAMKEVLQDKQKCQAFKEVALSIFKAKFDIEQFAHAYVSLYTREGRFS